MQSITIHVFLISELEMRYWYKTRYCWLIPVGIILVIIILATNPNMFLYKIQSVIDNSGQPQREKYRNQPSNHGSKSPDRKNLNPKASRQITLRKSKQSRKGFERHRLLEAVSNTLSMRLNRRDKRSIAVCLAHSQPIFHRASNEFFHKKQEGIRHTHHTYLNNNSTVIDIGGNIGIDASELISRYRIKTYFVLEPLTKFYNVLKQKFRHHPNVKLLNFGLGIATADVQVTIQEKDGVGTSLFRRVGENVVPIHIRNATEFFLETGLPILEVDLMTINCEGCEYEVIETLLYANLIDSVRHIQFATHVTLPGYNESPYFRYCRIQSLLSRTHRPTYQYKFVWETWTRRDLNNPKGPSRMVISE